MGFMAISFFASLKNAMKKKKMDWPIKSLDHIGTLFFI